MTKILLFGIGSGLTVEFEETCLRCGWDVVALVQNRAGEAFTLPSRNAIPVQELDQHLRAIPFLCPLFTPKNRHIACLEAIALGLAESPALVDPTAVIASSAEIGVGTYINAGVTIGALSRVGHRVIINRSASIGHHAIINDYVSIGPGVVCAGQVTIGRGVMLGAGSIVLPKIEIGGFAVIGAGSVVTRHVAARSRVQGNPAAVVETDLPMFD